MMGTWTVLDGPYKGMEFKTSDKSFEEMKRENENLCEDDKIRLYFALYNTKEEIEEIIKTKVPGSFKVITNANGDAVYSITQRFSFGDKNP